MKRKIFFSFFAIALTFAAFPPKPVLAATLSPGDLVKASRAAVYYVLDGSKRMTFPNETTYFSWYADFSSVKTITDAELAALQLTGMVTMRPGLYPVKLNSDPRVYAVAHDGTLRQLQDETVAKNIFGTDWNKKIKVIPDAFFTSYQLGSAITSSSEYAASTEKDASPTIVDDLNASLAPSQASVPVTTTPVVATPAPTALKSLFILWDPGRLDHPAPLKDAIQRVVFGTAPSVADYYSWQSNKHVKLEEVAMLGWYQANKDPEHYWSDSAVVHNEDGYKTGEAERVSEALTKADADFDFSTYDANRNGEITADELAVFIVIPQLDEVVAKEVSPLALEDPASVDFLADGVTFDSVGLLYLGTPVGGREKFGAIAHLYATYVLGLSDISTANGSFSLLSDPDTDLAFDPYTRASQGWITPTVIPKFQEVSTQILGGSDGSDTVIRIDRDQPLGPALGTEYFLLENRRRGIYDTDLPDEGITIWDVKGSTATLHRLVDSSPVDDTLALWYARPASLAAHVGIELKWSDGVRSGVALKNVGPSSAAMQFTLEKKILTERDLDTLASPIQ